MHASLAKFVRADSNSRAAVTEAERRFVRFFVELAATLSEGAETRWQRR